MSAAASASSVLITCVSHPVSGSSSAAVLLLPGARLQVSSSSPGCSSLPPLRAVLVPMFPPLPCFPRFSRFSLFLPRAAPLPQALPPPGLYPHPPAFCRFFLFFGPPLRAIFCRGVTSFRFIFASSSSAGYILPRRSSSSGFSAAPRYPLRTSVLPAHLPLAFFFRRHYGFRFGSVSKHLLPFPCGHSVARHPFRAAMRHIKQFGSLLINFQSIPYKYMNILPSKIQLYYANTNFFCNFAATFFNEQTNKKKRGVFRRA